MEAIRNFEELTTHLSLNGSRKRLVAVCPGDESTLNAIAKAIEMGFIDATLVGSKAEVEAFSPLNKHRSHIQIIDVEAPDEACRIAVKLIRDGKGDVLMKGLVNTDKLLRAILNKEYGILPQGKVLTHVTATQLSIYPKLLFFSDPAVIPYPTLEQRREQVKYLIKVCQDFGIAEPKVSLIHCTEKVNTKHFPVTGEYQILVSEAETGAFGKCIVDGPLDLKTSICEESMRIKGIHSPINGEADALLFPDIQAANVFYKTITAFPDTETATCLQGTMAPVALTSRSDKPSTKFYSLALACINSSHSTHTS